MWLKVTSPCIKVAHMHKHTRIDYCAHVSNIFFSNPWAVRYSWATWITTRTRFSLKASPPRISKITRSSTISRGTCKQCILIPHLCNTFLVLYKLPYLVDHFFHVHLANLETLVYPFPLHHLVLHGLLLLQNVRTNNDNALISHIMLKFPTRVVKPN